MNKRSFTYPANMAEATPGKGEQTQAGLIEAAFELFSKNGYHGTTMRQIADRAGLTPGAIYNHFSGKDDIFLAVVQAYHPLNKIVPILAEAQGERTEQFIGNAAELFSQAMAEDPGLINLALIELVELDGRHLPELVNAFRPQVLAFIRRLEESQPQIRRVSVDTAFRAFLGMFFAYELTGRILGLSEVSPELNPAPHAQNDLKDFVDIFLWGILRPPTPGKP